MRGHAISGTFAAPASAKTVLAILASATRRAKLRQVVIGSTDATPTNTQVLFSLRNITADGTGTGGSCYQDDPADGAPSITQKTAYTVEPTYQTGSIDIPLNNASSIIWEPPDPSNPPATNLSGGTVIGIGVVMNGGASGKNYNITLFFEE